MIYHFACRLHQGASYKLYGLKSYLNFEKLFYYLNGENEYIINNSRQEQPVESLNFLYLKVSLKDNRLL